MSVQFQYYDTVTHGYTGILTVASGLLVTDGSGIPSFSATYAGQSSITTLGTITTGVWNGTVVAGLYGGTGVANSGKTITLGGNLAISGAFATTLTATATTTLTLPTTGTLATLAGTETLTNKTLTTPTMTGPAVVNSASAGAQAVLSFSDAGTIKWQMGKQTDNIFFGYDTVGSKYWVQVSTAGVTTLGELGSTGNSLRGVWAVEGSTSGTLIIKPPAVAGTNTLTLPAGTTDFSATGGTSRFVKQATAGAALTVAQPEAADLSDYAEGTWTPVDDSASLSLTVTDARYIRIGKMCMVSFAIVYPLTVNGSPNQIRGLPFTAYSGTNSVGGGGLSYTDVGSELKILVGNAQSVFQFYNLAGAALTNAALSLKTVRATFVYYIA